MAFSIIYKPLFEVNILHQYFLNNGTEEFLTMTDAEKEKQLIDFNVSNFFSVLPTSLCQQKLHGHNMVFKASNSGFAVWVKVTNSNASIPFISLDHSLELTFIMKLTNPGFFNYTELEFESADKLFLFSNLRPGTELNNFPLIKKSGSNNSVKENSALGGESTINELKQLSNSEKDGLFGLVKIAMRGHNNGLSITNNQGEMRSPYRVFQILFENRKTTWRYFFDEDQQVKGSDDVKKESGNARQLVTRQKQPLTSNGFVSVELGGVELPNPSASLVKPNSTNTKIYSEIYM